MTPTNSLNFAPSRVRRATILMAAACLVFVAACEDPNANKATFTNADQPFAVAALTGSDVTAPAGLSLANRTVVRIDGVFDFDLAFDLNSAGQVVVLPVGKVGAPLSGTRFLGLKRGGVSYDQLTEAPKSGYISDSTMVITLGAGVVVQSQASNCVYSLTPYTFAKITIDSVNPVKRTLYGRALINLNCGLRQLTPGLPSF
jgi:hypothetical protein